MAHLRFVGRSPHIKYTLDFLGIGFDPILGYYVVAKIFYLRLWKETLVNFAFSAGLTKAVC